MLTSVELQAAMPVSLPSIDSAARMGASEYRPLLAALPISAAILGGMALDNGALMAGGAVVAFVAAIASPPVGLAVLALMAPLKSPQAIPAPGFNSLLVGAILLGCVYRLPIDRPSLRPSVPLLLILGFVLYVAMQQVPELLSGYAAAEGHLVGYLFGQLLTLAGLVVAAAYVLRGRSPVPFVGAALASALVAAVLAIAVYSDPTGPVANLVGLADANPRVVGPFGDPNYFGLFEATAIAASLAWMVVARSRPLRLLLLGTSIVLAVALAITLSRGALLALSAGLLSLAFTRSRRAGFLAIGALVVLAVGVYPLFVEWRVTADAGRLSAQAYAGLAYSDQARLAAALAAPQLFATSPLFGIGFGHYALMSSRYVGFPIESHNWYANVLAEQGIVGMALWIPMLAAVAIGLYRSSRSARCVGLAVFVTYAVGSAFLQPPLSVQTSAFAVVVIVAALVGDWSRVGVDHGRPSGWSPEPKPQLSYP